MIKFIVDTQLPPILSKFLRNKGFDAIHTTDFTNGHLLQDDEIIQLSIQENRIIITKDSDFLDHFLLKGTPPKVMLVKLGNISNGELLAVFDANIALTVVAFEESAGLVMLSHSQITTY